MVKKLILVADADRQTTRVLQQSLPSTDFEIYAVAETESALGIFFEHSPDLVIADLSVPQTGGIKLCREIRKHSQIPIIILSISGEEKTKVKAFDAGADDYVTKPFGTGELLARVRAALRRSTSAVAETVYQVGDFVVNTETLQVHVREQEVHLTPKEFALLVYLIKNREKVLTHQTLLEAIWGEGFIEQPEYLRVFLGNLRKKIEPNPSKPQYILTKPWIGYRFQPKGAGS